MNYTVLLLLLICCMVYVFSKHADIDLDIPWPSGIIIDRLQDPLTGNIYRFGRLQYNAVMFRRKWTSIHGVENVLSIDECRSIIEDVENHVAIHGWSVGRHIDYSIRPTKDIPLRSVYKTEDEHQWIDERFRSVLFPKYQEFYNINSSLLRVDDLFVTKYISDSSIENALAPHTDKTPWSFVLTLNNDFEGGGTFFKDQEVLYRPPIGTAVIFSGKQSHGGYPITRGDRFILAGFVTYGNIDEVGDESHEQFLTLYDPIYDGYAASHGFRTGDLIIAIETCHKDPMNETIIIKESTPVTTDMTDEQWIIAAQSCEILVPGENTKIRIRRAVKE